MTQKTIIEALQKSLTQGSGSLDDLANLLKRAQADIEDAKREEAEAAAKAEEKRADNIAQIATRLLNNKLTAADMALIMNSFYGSRGLQEIWTADGIETLVTECDKKDKEVNDAAEKVANELVDLFKTLFDIDVEDVKVERKKPAAKSKSKDPDDVIDNFLKSFGLK